MAFNYRPSAPFNVPMKLLIPIETKVKGVVKKTFPEPENAPLIFGSFRTFNGTENISNDLYMVFDTGRIDTWYRPDITSKCRVYICETGQIYEVKGTPENINMRNQYMSFRVEAVGGGA